MRRTDEEFAAEVMRRSSIYRVQKKKQMHRLAAASVSVFAIVLLCGAYQSCLEQGESLPLFVFAERLQQFYHLCERAF